MTDIARLDIQVKSDGTIVARNRLERLGDEAQRTERKTLTATQRMRSGFNKLKGAVFSLQGAFAALGGALVLREVVRSSIELQRINNALKAATGSSEEAAEEFDFVRSEAERLGLSLRSTASEYASLAAAARGTTLEGQATRDIFVGVSEAATVLGLSAEQTGGALTAIQQIISKGTVSAEELRGQLGERLPGAFQIAARSMGVTTQKLGELLQQGAVASDEFLPKFARELRKTFSSDAEQAANGLQQEINRLQTAFFNITSSGDVDGLASSIGELADTLNEPATRDGLQFLIQNLIDATSAAARFGAGLGRLSTDIRQFFGFVPDTVASLKSELEQIDELLAGEGSRFGLRTVGGEFQIHVSDEELQAERERVVAEIKRLEEIQKNLPGSGRGDGDGSGDGGGGGGGRTTSSKVPQIQREIEALSRQVSLYGELTNAEEARIAIAEGFYGTVNPAQEKQLLALAKELDAKEQAAEKTERQIELEKDLAEEKNRILDQVEEFERQILSEEEKLRDSYRRRIEIIQDAESRRIITSRRADDIIKGQREKLEEEIRALSEETTDELSEFAIQAARNIESAFADFLFDPFEDGLEGMLSSFATTLRRMAAEAAASQILDSVVGGLSGGEGGGFAQAFGSIFGGARASGGPVHAGQIHRVNENGPEMLSIGNRDFLMTGSQSGTVSPQVDVSPNLTVNVYSNDPNTRVEFGNSAVDSRNRQRQLRKDQRHM